MAKLKVMNSHCLWVRCGDEVEGPRQTHDGVEASEGGTDSKTSETRLCDGTVDNPLLAEAVEQALGDLVAGALLAPERTAFFHDTGGIAPRPILQAP